MLGMPLRKLGPAAGCAAPGTIGHTGFTGTGCGRLDDGKAWTLLTNRIHPTRHFNSGIATLRRLRRSRQRGLKHDPEKAGPVFGKIMLNKEFDHGTNLAVWTR